jgi:hypothetical protein
MFIRAQPKREAAAGKASLRSHGQIHRQNRSRASRGTPPLTLARHATRRLARDRTSTPGPSTPAAARRYLLRII